MIRRAPDLPWCPERTRRVARGQVLLRVAPGEDPARIPYHLEAQRGRMPAALSFDGGPVDQALRRFTPATRITRAFASAHKLGAPGQRHLAWDALEDELGLSRTFRVEVDPDADLRPLTEELSALAVVESATANYLAVTPFDHALRAPEHEQPRSVTRPKDPWYGHRMVGAVEALRFEAGDSTLIVAVVDSGVHLEHPELSGRLRPGVDTVDLPAEPSGRGLRFIGDTRDPDRTPRDEIGHGTACASIISARGRKLPHGLGGASPSLPVRVLAGARLGDKAGLTAIGSIMDIDAGVKTAIDLGARVLNLSFGTPESALREDDPRPHAAIVAYARRRGCILVAAAGNSGQRERYYPACLDGVIAVGSVGPEGRPSRFSTRGDHVDLSAPGEHILGAGLNGYQENTGTSFAAPFVTGACALLMARAARYGKPLDGDVARELLQRTAKSFPRDADARGSGSGILDVPAALGALEAALARGEPSHLPAWPGLAPRDAVDHA